MGEFERFTIYGGGFADIDVYCFFLSFVHNFSGQVGNVITNRNANRLEFERLLDGAKTYMRHHKVMDSC